MTFASPGLSSISEGRHGNRQGKCGDVAWLQLIAGPDSLPAVVLVMGRSDGPIQGAAVLIMLLAASSSPTSRCGWPNLWSKGSARPAPTWSGGFQGFCQRAWPGCSSSMACAKPPSGDLPHYSGTD
jgi:hypothetical protein